MEGTNEVVGVIDEDLEIEDVLDGEDELVDDSLEELLVGAIASDDDKDLEFEDVLDGGGDELVDGSLEELLVGVIVSDDDKDLERETELVSEIEGVTLGVSDGLMLWKSAVIRPPFPDIDDEDCCPHVPSIL